ncbi:MAG: type II and III secretion system protein family protein [Hyphomicrobiaceae bacterium]|nr:type II and III secretion system protein family protein [Hyphomicrobiaceae bacterium]
MRNYSKKTYGAVLAGLIGLAIASLAPAPADAGGGSRNGVRPVATQIPYETDHNSMIRISERDGFPMHRGIRLARNKSMLVEVSRELRDVIVSNPDLVDAVVQSANRVYLIGKKVGQANAFFFDANGEQIITFELTVEQDTAVLDSLFKRLLPGSNIKAEVLNETVILTGSVRSPSDSSRAADIASRFIVGPTPEADARQSKKVINLLQVEAEEQVMLRVTVAEVERSVLKQFGINLSTELNAGNFATGLLTANAFPLTTVAGLGGALKTGADTSQAMGRGCNVVGDLIQKDPPVLGSSGNYGFWSSNQNCVSHAIKALERNGLIKTLAEPNLTAISGESAKFLAGGEFPVPVSVNGNQIGVSFKEFGVSVAFTPVVLTEGRINLKIETVVSELSDAGAIQISGIALPALKKREAKSTVELPSGGTLALAGLISDDTRKNIDGLPGLKDLPVLGTLFRSQDFIKRETELVVMVTPYVVRPVARKDMARPTDGMSPASDLKSNVLGHMNRVYGKNVPAGAEGGLKDGTIGFIVD